jgi:hypothetical protein
VYRTVFVDSLVQLRHVFNLFSGGEYRIHTGLKMFQLKLLHKSNSENEVRDIVSNIISRSIRLEGFKIPNDWSAPFLRKSLRALNRSLVYLEITVSFKDFDIIPMINRFTTLHTLTLAFGIAPRLTSKLKLRPLHLLHLRHFKLVSGYSLHLHPEALRFLSLTRLGPECDVFLSLFSFELLKEIDRLFQTNTTSSITINGANHIGSTSSALLHTNKFSIDCMPPPALFLADRVPSIIHVKCFWEDDISHLMDILNVLRQTTHHGLIQLHVGIKIGTALGECHFHSQTFSSVLWDHLKGYKKKLSERGIEVYDHCGRSLQNRFR